MPESFGVRMRQRREEQGIALASIAEQTKIKLSLLEALERDDVGHWPSGIFRRAYIRTYAHAIGLNPDVVVREFLETFPEPAEIVEPLSAVASAARPVRPAGPPTRLRYLLNSAIDSVSRMRRPPPARDAALQEPAPVPPGPGSELRPAAGASAHRPAPTVEQDRATTGLSSAIEPAPVSDIDFMAVANLCTELGRTGTVHDVYRVLHQAATVLGANGLIVWVWDARSADLRPLLVHGYSDKVLAQLPAVKQDADNATAAAFRSGQTCAVNGSAGSSGALVIPLMNADGCGGVLALELPRGRERATAVCAAATILASVLGQLIGPADAGAAQPAEAEPQPQRAANAASRSGG